MNRREALVSILASSTAACTRLRGIPAHFVAFDLVEAAVRLVCENVETGSTVYTDELLSYDALNADFTHQVINHAESYVNGSIHTNGCENFWSLLKRGVHGTYVSIEPFHLFRYVDEQAFRYNQRGLNDAERFDMAVSQIVDRRLTYAELTGHADDEPF